MANQLRFCHDETVPNVRRRIIAPILTRNNEDSKPLLQFKRAKRPSRLNQYCRKGRT